MSQVTIKAHLLVELGTGNNESVNAVRNNMNEVGDFKGAHNIIITKAPLITKQPKDRKVIPDPIDDREFQELKESGKDGILLGITLNPKKCIGEKVRRIPINIKCR